MDKCCENPMLSNTTLPNEDQVYTCSNCHSQEIVPVVPPYRIKYSWMVTKDWDVLHYVAAIRDWDDRYWELHESQFDTGFRWETACGLREMLQAPGIFSRMGRPRCEACCTALGITQGIGCPVNDSTCQPIDES